MKSLFTLIGLLYATASWSQIQIDTSSLHYVQNFDSLDASGSSLTRMPFGWSFFEWGGSSCNANYRAGTGSTSTGDTYSYGLAGTERALGSLCSSGMPNVCYGLRFVNKSGSYINAVDITFKAEQWRRNGSGKTDSLLFYYSTALNANIQDSSFSKWTQVPELLVTSITTALPAAAINGNDSSKRISFSLPLAFAPGDSICFRWYDYNAVASDDGLAIDSLELLFRPGFPAGYFRPHAVRLFPEPGAQNVSTSLIPTIEFDRSVVKGATGAVYIKDRTTQLIQTLTVGNSKLKCTGNKANLNLLSFLPGHHYQITFDSTTFDTAGFHCIGLYDTSAWTFRIESTTGIDPSISNDEIFIENPVRNGVIRLTSSAQSNMSVRIVVSDLQGRVISNGEFDFHSNQLIEQRLNVRPGIYLASIWTANGLVRRKILVE